MIIINASIGINSEDLKTIGKEQEKKVFVYRSHLELIDDIKRKKNEGLY